jgi:hypothetical protein
MEVMGEVVLTNEGCIPYSGNRQHSTPSTLRGSSRKLLTLADTRSLSRRKSSTSAESIVSKLQENSVRKSTSAVENNSFQTAYDSEARNAVDTILGETGEVMEDNVDEGQDDHITVEMILDEDGHILYNATIDDDVDVGADVVTSKPSNILLQMTSDGLTVDQQLTSEEKSGRNRHGDKTADSFSQGDKTADESFSQGVKAGDSFLQGVKARDSFSLGDKDVPIENDTKDGNHSAPSSVCKYCLRAFSSPFLLYRHVAR